VETVTVAADRIAEAHGSGTAVLLGIGLVIVAVVLMVLSGVRRQRQQPRA
jgi:hypothetical protein